MNRIGYTIKQMIRAWAMAEYLSPWGLVNLGLSFLVLSGLSFVIGAEEAGLITLGISIAIWVSLFVMKSRRNGEPLLYEQK